MTGIALRFGFSCFITIFALYAFISEFDHLEQQHLGSISRLSDGPKTTTLKIQQQQQELNSAISINHEHQDPSSVVTHTNNIENDQVIKKDIEAKKSNLKGTNISPVSASLNKNATISLYDYLSSMWSPQSIILLKWDPSGILVRSSPIDIPDWFPMKSARLFDNVGKSAFGKAALVLNANFPIGIQWDVKPPVPLLAYTLPKACEKNKNNFFLLPSPYDRDGFSRWNIFQAEKVITPFDQRKNIIIWRGKHHDLPNRIKLLELSQQQDPNKIWLDAVNIEKNISELMEKSDMSEYKYQLDIEGETGTEWGGLRWKMCSGNLVFKVDTWSRDWWHDTIEPWKHYIPVKEDLSNLRERYEWAERHPKEVSKIVISGQDICLKSATEMVIEKYQSGVMQSLPSSSQDVMKEVDAILDGLGSFWKNVDQTTVFDRNKMPIEQDPKESPPTKTETLPVPSDGDPSTSIYRYLESANYPHMIAILKWNSSGILERVSPLDIPPWLPKDSLKLFEKTRPSKYGTVAFLLNTDVMSAVPWATEPPIPFLAYTLPKKLQNDTRFTLVPNPYDRESFNRACIKHAEKVTLKVPFNERKNVIVWRGIPHGTSDRNRYKLFEMSKEDPNNEWLDAVNIEEDSSARLERDDMSRWRYQLDIGGESGTTWGSLRWKMCSGNLVFKVDSWAKDWWHDTIEPWKHYIPVKEDLSDLREKYEWAEKHPNKVDEIIARAVPTCKASVTVETVAKYYYDVIQSLPPASAKLAKEADAILDGLGSFYQKILEKQPGN